MSIESHLVELERRRESLKKAIHESELHPSADPLEIAELKRKKLKLKDEIEKLRQSAVEKVAH